MRRRYKDPMLQHIYDHMREHPPILDGRRHRGASHRAAFWQGVDGLLRGKSIPYVQQSQGWACYMAGRDSRNDEAVRNAERVNIAWGILG